MLNLFLTSPELEAIIQKLHLPVFSKRDTELTYRAINHYQKLGIIKEIRQNKMSWRKFSGYEFIWLDIIVQLRNFGVRLEDILQLRNKLFVEGELGYIDKARFINRSYFEEIASSIHSDYKLYLIVFSDYTFTFHDSQSLKQWLEKSYKDESNISIPLTKSIRNVWDIIKD